MFVKLQYTSPKYIHDVLRTLNAIINDSSITSATVLASKIPTYAPQMYAGFDSSRSTIIRTNNPTTTKSHYARVSFSSEASQHFVFSMEFKVPDSDRKTYIQLTSAGNANRAHLYVCDGFTYGANPITSAQMSNSTSSTTSGTYLVPSGTSFSTTTSNYQASGVNGAEGIKTFWAYVTDKCFVWCATLVDDTNTGFGSAFDNTKFVGPFIHSMYTRFDYWNKDSNDIIPFYYTNPHGIGQGFGGGADFNNVQNPDYTTNAIQGSGSRVFNIVDALPKVSTAFPDIYHPYVNLRLGHISNNMFGHLSSTYAAATSTNTVSYSRTIDTTAYTRYPNADLTAATFANIPIGWDNWYKGCHGGNVSEESGVYLFNGDYVPGDTFSVGGKVYMIWPVYGYGYTSRLGLSIPME